MGSKAEKALVRSLTNIVSDFVRDMLKDENNAEDKTSETKDQPWWYNPDDID